MLRAILSLLASVCLVVCSPAQRTELYAIGGLSSAIMKQNGTADNFRRHYSWHTGVLFDIGAENVMFETGLLYSTRGTDIGSTSGLPGLNFTEFTALKITYLDIPAMLVIAPSNLRLFIGPQLSTMTRVMYDGEVMSSDQVSRNFNKTSLGIRYGLGVTTDSNLVFQVHMISGLSDIYKHPDYKWKNNAWQFAVGYRFYHDYTPIPVSSPGSNKKSKKKDNLIPDHRMLD
jgi:hypothetical protein